MLRTLLYQYYVIHIKTFVNGKEKRQRGTVKRRGSLPFGIWVAMCARVQELGPHGWVGAQGANLPKE